jgi:pyruvate-ferredoxin/flavodoxin oxidoreductase
LAYIDDNGAQQLMEIPFTVADFAYQEGRFNKHFQPVKDSDKPIPIHEYIDLDEQKRHDSVPFIWSVDKNQKLIKLTMTSAIVDLTRERRKNWRMLEYLAGLHVDKLQEAHMEEIRQWTEKYEATNRAREASIDSIARSMAELASSTDAAVIRDEKIIPVKNEPADVVETADGSSALPLVEILEADAAKCTNCKTCYQDLPELFEKTQIVDGGNVKEVSRVIPGVFDKIKITPELQRKAARVADDCDVEIIRYHAQG